MTPPPARAAADADTPLVRGEQLVRSFSTRGGPLAGGAEVLALRGIDFRIARGEAVGVVGESGCGKSTLARVALGLIAPSRGRVLLDGQDLAGLPRPALRALRRRLQIVFQDPYGTLDPRRPVGAQVADGLIIHRLATRRAAPGRAAHLLEQVGLPADHARRLPHQLSGGQRQRVAIARALATGPDLLVADEPVSALDVSVQAQVINLLSDLRGELGLALLFISHDLHVVRHLCDRVMVMYLGRIVEEGPADAVLRTPRHPYTRALVAATPSLRRRRSQQATALVGDVPSATAPPSGCAFRTRCAAAQPRCAAETPLLRPVASAGQAIACLRAEELA